MAKQLIESRLCVRFIDSSDGKELKIQLGENEKKATIEVEMQSEFAHEFWLGNKNPAVAMLQEKIVSRGPLNKALALIPAIRPAFRIYPVVLNDVNKRVA